jgi:hypothetical protein
MLVKRVETYFGRPVSEAYLLDMVPSQLGGKLNTVLEERFQGEGKWKNAPMYRVLMSLIRRRPRDLVKLLHLAAGEARRDRASKISTAHFRAVFEKYSQDRIQDTVNEYRSELPDVERLLLGMKPNRRERKARAGYYYNTAELFERIKSIIETGAFRDARGRVLSAKQLAAFMYKVNMIVASKEKESGFIDRRYFEENRYLSSEIVDFGFGGSSSRIPMGAATG